MWFHQHNPVDLGSSLHQSLLGETWNRVGKEAPGATGVTLPISTRTRGMVDSSNSIRPLEAQQLQGSVCLSWKFGRTHCSSALTPKIDMTPQNYLIHPIRICFLPRFDHRWSTDQLVSLGVTCHPRISRNGSSAA